MKKTILLSLFLLFNVLAQAQQLLVSSTYAAQQGRSSEEISPSVLVKNSSTRTMELRWERVRNNMPQGWDAVVCDKQCYNTLVDSKIFTLAPGESVSDFRVLFRPNGIEGIGNVEIKIYEVRNPSNTVTVAFSGSAQQSGGNSSFSGSAPSIYPNPAVDHIQIQDGSEVKFLEIYNVVGRKIEDFTVNNGTGKYDVSELPRGMYMVRMLDRNRNIIRTQRISKYNP